MQENGPQPGRSNYLDFELEIGPGRGREYPVAVLRSPAGEARGTLHFPFDELALENRLLNLQNALLRSGGKHRRVPSPEEEAVRDLGRALFDSLFSDEIRSHYDASLREAARQERGLRLKVHFRPPELGALPWEFMYDPRQAEYLCLSRRTPIVRYLESPQPIRPLSVSPPLRILGMVASPSDLPSLDIEREKQRVEQAVQGLRARELVELAWLPGQTWRDLQEAMWGGPWHIFHFIGHGGFDVNRDEGFVALADGEGRSHCLSATHLGRFLADHTPLRLVLLNACEGARGGDRDVFSSTASILVGRGIPAVLAMQYEITDRAAVELARAFYRALAHGMAVDEALAAARKAISVSVANTVEWGTPVLYMRALDGVIFCMADRPPPQDPGPAPEVDDRGEGRLEQLYLDGLDAFRAEAWDEARRYFQAIVDERPDYQDAAARLGEVQRRQALIRLYEQAQAACEAEEWPAARAALEKLVAQAPDFQDASALLERVKEQEQLADLYAEAVRLLRDGQYQAALDKWEQVQAQDPQYPDRDGVQARARQKLAPPAGAAAPEREAARLAAKGAGPRRAALPGWFWPVAGGAAALLVLAIVVIVALGGTGGGRATPTTTSGPTATRTEAPGPTAVLTKAPEPTAVPTEAPEPTAPVIEEPSAAQPPAAADAGDTWTNPADGTVMVYVPAGEFTMGSTDADIDAILAECSDCQRDKYTDEQPQHTVYLDAFWIGRTEVTNAQFRECVEAGTCQAATTCDWGDATYDDEDKANHPVVCVAWEQAQAYCRWAGGRLPTEAEWEKAARGTDGRRFPWGDGAPDCNKAQYGECGGQTVPVGSKAGGASPYGALDMAGNVWDWVADWYADDYYASSPEGNPPGPGSGSERVLRGGGWNGGWHVLCAAVRSLYEPANRSYNVGFRCVRVSPGE